MLHFSMTASVIGHLLTVPGAAGACDLGIRLYRDSGVIAHHVFLLSRKYTPRLPRLIILSSNIPQNC